MRESNRLSNPSLLLRTRLLGQYCESRRETVSFLAPAVITNADFWYQLVISTAAWIGLALICFVVNMYPIRLFAGLTYIFSCLIGINANGCTAGTTMCPLRIGLDTVVGRRCSSLDREYADDQHYGHEQWNNSFCHDHYILSVSRKHTACWGFIPRTWSAGADGRWNDPAEIHFIPPLSIALANAGWMKAGLRFGFRSTAKSLAERKKHFNPCCANGRKSIPNGQSIFWYRFTEHNILCSPCWHKKASLCYQREAYK